MEWGAILAFAIGLPVILFPVAFIWFLNIGGISAAIKGRSAIKQPEKSHSNQTCSVDTDCPVGYVCIDGSCVPEGTV